MLRRRINLKQVLLMQRGVAGLHAAIDYINSVGFDIIEEREVVGN